MFVDNQPHVVLAWEDGPAAGLEITCVVTSQAAAEATERFVDRLHGEVFREKDVSRYAAVFVDHVASWSIVDRRGRPVPVTAARFLRLHKDEVVVPVLQQWAAAVRNPPLVEPATPAPEPAVVDHDPVVDEPWSQEPASWEPETYPDIENVLSVQNLTDPADDWADQVTAAEGG